jgi:hypothetical protein
MLNQLPRRRQAWTILRRASVVATSTSAVMPGALPVEWRFALVATHPTSPLSIFGNLSFWSVANAEYRNGQPAPSCRAASTTAAMCRRQSLSLVATAHHRFTRFDAL